MLDSDGVVRGEAAARYQNTVTAPAGRADPEGWRRGLAAALEMLRATVRDAGVPEAVCMGGQSPTTVPAGSGLAFTCRHPAGATESPEGQHRRQYEQLRAEAGDHVVPMQLWDWMLTRLGAPARQGRWPGDPELEGYGEVVLTGEVVGVADGTDAVPPGTPLVAGAQDVYLAFWAAGTDIPGRALDPGGRTGGLGVAGRRSGACPEGMYGLCSAAPGVDIVGGPVSSHGLALEWLATVTGQSLEELLAVAATVAPGAGGVLALPYFEGERAPCWNRELRAELVGIGPDTGPAELARRVAREHCVRPRGHRGRARRGRRARRRSWCAAVRRRVAGSGARSRARCWSCRSRFRSTPTSPCTAPRSRRVPRSVGGRSRESARRVRGRAPPSP